MRVIPAVLTLCLLAACADEQNPPAQRTAEAPVLVLSAADSARVLSEGGAVASAIAQGLAQRLQAELAAEGAAGAVDFCSRTALTLTDSLLATTKATAVKRTSTRIRNPENLPDEHERVALAWFDSVQAAGGERPASYLQAVGDDELRFYRPLMIAPFCTQCHGTPEQIDPEVQRILAERYPSDQATGYSQGDMRGLIRVSLPRTAP